MTPELRPAAPADADAVAALAAAHPWPEYGFYRVFGFDFATPHLVRAAERFAAALAIADGEGAGVLATARGAAVGFAGVARQAFETTHFGVEMGSVPFLFAPVEPEARAAAVAALLGAAEDGARARGLAHLSLRLDVHDVAGLAAAQRRGWRVVDTLVTWVHDSGAGADADDLEPPAPGGAEFERVTLAKAELPLVPREELAPLEEFMRRAYRIDRFHADARLPAARSDELYVAWLHRIFDARWADGAQTIRRDGRLVGFCSFQHAADVERDYGGPRIIGRGLAAVLPEGKGGYAVLTRMIHRSCPLGSRFQEFDTQIQNFPTVNVWAREGMRFVRARVTLHRWLDERAVGE